MNISKQKKFNKYFQKIIFITVLLSLSLVPWIEFINSNLSELDFIFNDNLVVLLSLYFLLISLVYLILKKLTPLKKYSLIAFISISLWILFQHRFLRSSFIKLFKSINISTDFSSEIALIAIISFIYFFFILIKRGRIFTIFFMFFLTFNLIFSSFQFGKEFFNQKKNYIIDQKKITLVNNIKRPNIYFFYFRWYDAT